MDAYNHEKVDEIVLALLSLTLHDGDRAWKGIDWEVLDRLYEKGWIESPRNTAKSVRLTQEGLARSTGLFEQYFGTSQEAPDAS